MAKLSIQLLLSSITLLCIIVSALTHQNLIEIFPDCRLVDSERYDLFESNTKCCRAYWDWCMEDADITSMNCSVLHEELPNNISTECSQTDLNDCEFFFNQSSSNNSKPDGMWCLELDDLLNMPDSLTNTRVLLYSGTHVIRQSQETVLHNLYNVSIEGEENSAVFITCSHGYGLTVLNATSLHIANITFNRCSLSGPRLSKAVHLLNDLVKINFYIPHMLKIGVFIGVARNLVLENIVVANTSGIGLVGVNIVGRSVFTNLMLVDNTSPNCSNIDTIPLSLFRNDSSINYRIGGGMYLLYENTVDEISPALIPNFTSLSIRHSEFLRNSECGYSGYTNINFQYFRDTRKLQYTIGAGGGLSIFTTQDQYPLHVNVENSTFLGNGAVYGSGVHIGLFAHTSNTKIMFSKCNFIENGHSFSKGGGGIAVFLNLHERYHFDHGTLGCEECKIITVEDSVFEANRVAGQGGGLLAYSLANYELTEYRISGYNNVVALKRCLFTSNGAIFGSALYASQRVSHGLDGLFGVLVEDVVMEKNFMHSGDTVFARGVGSNPTAIMNLRSVNLEIKRGRLTIKDSESTAISISCGLILMNNDTSLTLLNNRGARSGGLYLGGLTPAIIVSENCTLNFTNNRASTQGGAILFDSAFLGELDDFYPLNAGDCFLFHQNVLSTSSLHSSDSSFYFKDNDAPRGSIIYGSSLHLCPWAHGLNSSNVLMELNDYSATFAFSSPPNTTKAVSSEPFALRISNNSKYIEAFPGRLTNVSLEVVDIFNNSIEAVIVVDYSYANFSKISNIDFSDFVYKRENESSIVISIPEISSHDLIVSLYTESNLVGDSLTLSVKKCPLGFAYNLSGSSGTCQCIYENISGIYCNNEDVTITVMGNTWLGCPNKFCSTFAEMVVKSCIFDYCDPLNVTFNASDTSNQCSPGSFREGVVCGKCMDGYAITYSGSICRKCDASSYYVLSLIAVDIILIVILLCVVKITIDKEWTNIFFLFCNIVFPYDVLGNRGISYFVRSLYLARLVSRDRYSDECYFEVRSAIHRSAISLALPIYFILFIAIFAKFCQYSSFMTNYFSPAKTVMTVAYIFYVQIFRYCIEILAPTIFQTINREMIYVRWAIDPNVHYFQDVFHGIFGFIAIVLVILYLISLVILLLFPTKVYKFFNKFYPVLDIIWAPFKKNYRPWAAIRLIFSIAVVLVCKYNTIYSLSFPVVICLIGGFLYIQTNIQPFKSRLANTLDGLFLFVVQVIHVIGFLLYEYEDKGPSVLVGLAWFGVLLLVLSYGFFLLHSYGIGEKI